MVVLLHENQNVEILSVLGIETCIIDQQLVRQPQLLIDGKIHSLAEARQLWPLSTMAELHQAFWPPECDVVMLRGVVEDMIAASTAARQAQEIANNN